ncbi:MAG: class I SAM-dependent methyltransferase [Thermoplasmata archaeon]
MDITGKKMTEDIERWEKKKGIEFMERLGLKSGYQVLDFGAGYGHYTIPAAKFIGKDGVVYAVDKREEPLSAIAEKVSKYGLSNVKVVKNSDGVTLRFDSDFIDVVLLFDILHYMEEEKRNKLYGEVYRVLKPGGKLFVYPKHTRDDFPMGEFADMRNEDVADEVQREGLLFDEKICGEIAHDEELDRGCVFKFVKPED